MEDDDQIILAIPKDAIEALENDPAQMAIIDTCCRHAVAQALLAHRHGEKQNGPLPAHALNQVYAEALRHGAEEMQKYIDVGSVPDPLRPQAGQAIFSLLVEKRFGFVTQDLFAMDGLTLRAELIEMTARIEAFDNEKVNQHVSDILNKGWQDPGFMALVSQHCFYHAAQKTLDHRLENPSRELSVAEKRDIRETTIIAAADSFCRAKGFKAIDPKLAEHPEAAGVLFQALARSQIERLVPDDFFRKNRASLALLIVNQGVTLNNQGLMETPPGFAAQREQAVRTILSAHKNGFGTAVLQPLKVKTQAGQDLRVL